MVLTEAQSKRIQLVVIAMATVFFVLVLTLLFLTAIRINNRAQLRALQAERAHLEAQIAAVTANMNWLESDAFIYDYAMRYLNLTR